MNDLKKLIGSKMVENKWNG